MFPRRHPDPAARLPSPHPLLVVSLFLALASPAVAGWQVLPPFDQHQSRPPKADATGTAIQPGDRWPNDARFRWLLGDLEIPETLGQEAVRGKILGLQINCGDGGEIWLRDQLQCRFDNDHPGLVIVTNPALPGMHVSLAVQVYGKVQGGDKFDQASWTLLDPKRAEERLLLVIDPTRVSGKVPSGIVGLSQGGGMTDYDAATAQKLREGGFKWFRMDNVFTSAVKLGATGQLEYNWTDFDRRVDFIQQIGAEPIFAVSYMPQPLDAIPDNERHSAPKDYASWEELCFQAARHSRERGRPIPFWEVWNEVNSGWLKPGPDDTGSEPFRKLYAQALGREETNLAIVRRFEAYCKLYRATANGVRRADPQARIGGPALASGPMENSPDCGHCSHGQGFARGLMFWCDQEKLPLDFVSWHEYFQTPETIVKEARTFREDLDAVPSLKQSVKSFMVTEWNEAWWPDRPQDHELGAAWCANSITRAFLPAHIDRPCFFYVKQADQNFRGDYSLLLQNNVPKASYNVARIFNGLSGDWISLNGTDGDVSGVAAWDAERGRLAVVLVNFRDRYSLRRRVHLQMDALPVSLRGGKWQEWTVDATHSNAWDDLGRAELAKTGNGDLGATNFILEKTLPPNSVTLVELMKP